MKGYFAQQEVLLSKLRYLFERGYNRCPEVLSFRSLDEEDRAVAVLMTDGSITLRVEVRLEPEIVLVLREEKAMTPEEKARLYDQLSWRQQRRYPWEDDIKQGWLERCRLELPAWSDYRRDLTAWLEREADLLR